MTTNDITGDKIKTKVNSELYRTAVYWENREKRLQDAKQLQQWKDERRIDKLICYYRTQKHMSIDKLSDEINRSRSLILRYESNELPELIEDIIPAICDALEITPNQFFGYE